MFLIYIFYAIVAGSRYAVIGCPLDRSTVSMSAQQAAANYIKKKKEVTSACLCTGRPTHPRFISISSFYVEPNFFWLFFLFYFTASAAHFHVASSCFRHSPKTCAAFSGMLFAGCFFASTLSYFDGMPSHVPSSD